MPTYLSAVFDGTAEPFWLHFILILVSVAASFGVAGGIILESPKYSSAIHRVATWLVIGGVAIEALCMVSLFVFDEAISSAQQLKIISLEERLAARRLSDKQVSNMTDRLKPFAPQTFQIIPYWKNPESLYIANRIADVLIKAGWEIDNPKVFTTLVGVLTGVIVSTDKDAPPNIREARDELIAALKHNGVESYADEFIETPPSSRINMQVGIKP